MSIFYVSAHSKIPKQYREIDEVPADIQISELVRERGPAIYVIDTCRAHRKVTIPELRRREKVRIELI